MKIACIIHSLDGGGAERVLAGLASRLAERSHQVTLITLGDGQGDRHQVDPAVTRLRLDLLFSTSGWLSKMRGHQRRVGELRSTLSELSPDVVLSFCDRTNILTSLASPSTLPLVLSERSDPSQQTLGRGWEFLRDRGYPRATQLVALTDTSAEHLRRRFSVPVTVIPSAIERPTVFSDRPQAVANRRVLGIGRLEREKGFDRLIHAFQQALGDQPEWTLRILGEGSCRDDWESVIRTAQLQERVTMPGWSEDVQMELAGATFFVLPSRYEGFPSALLEAMAMGVPSIAVDCESGPRAVLTHSNRFAREDAAVGSESSGELREIAGKPFSGGMLVSDDPIALAEAMRLFACDAAGREAYGEAGKEVVDRFGWEAMVNAYEQVLKQAAHGSRPHR